MSAKCINVNYTCVISPTLSLSHTHTLGYNLTFQKRVSGFKTHQTAPAAKGIYVRIVHHFDDIYECTLAYDVLRERHYYEAKLI